MNLTSTPLVTTLLACVYLVSGCASAPTEVQERAPLWEASFQNKIEFQTLVDNDLLVAGTSRHLYGIDPRSGRQLWRMRNVHARAGDVITVGDAPYLLISDSAGGLFDDRGTNLLAVNRGTGEILWESALLSGKVLQAAVESARGILFVVSVSGSHGDDRGVLSSLLPGKGLFSGLEREPVLHALELSTGRLLWSRNFGQEVRMQAVPVDEPSTARELEYTRPFVLSLYRAPLAGMERVCLTYSGIRCYGSTTGEPLWEQSFDVLSDSLALSYADPVVDGRLLYTSGDSRVRAFDMETGKQVWRSRRLGPVPELYYDQRAIFAQLGGHFYDIASEEWKWKGSFGAAALDRKSGELLWRFKDAAGAVTNLLIYGDRVWLADADELIALDRRSGAVLTRIEHELRDRPVYVALNADRRILLVGENEVAAYHEVTGKQLWHSWQRPVGPSLWSRFSGNLLHATGSVLKLGSYVVANVSGLLPAIPSLTLPLGGVSVKLINTKSLVVEKSGSAGRRFSYQSGSIDEDKGSAYLSGDHQFFVSEPKGHNQALAMVNLRNGETERLIALPSDEPNLVIDEGNRRVYQAFGARLVAISL